MQTSTVSLGIAVGFVFRRHRKACSRDHLVARVGGTMVEGELLGRHTLPFWVLASLTAVSLKVLFYVGKKVMTSSEMSQNPTQAGAVRNTGQTDSYEQRG